MSFLDHLQKYSTQDLQDLVYSCNELAVKQALNKNSLNLRDFAALLSPAAENYFLDILSKAKKITRTRFGNTLQMYAPMYVSNACNNICTYCGFSLNNKVARKILTDSELKQEFAAIAKLGFKHILIVSGEHHQAVAYDYFENAIKIAKQFFSQITLEVQPLSVQEYAKLINFGLYSVLVYQETYDQEAYKVFHPKGKKSNFAYRLETPERLGQAGIHKIGLGCLLGLTDWRIDSLRLAMHLNYLKKKFWKTKFSISFPRIRPAEGVEFVSEFISDQQLLQLACAYRLLDENLELSLSTRESEQFRNILFDTVFTSISAESKTEPGGYSIGDHALEQFEIADKRTVIEVVKQIKLKGIDPVWKDWDNWC